MGQYRPLEPGEPVWVLPDRAPALLTAWQQHDDGWHGVLRWSPVDPWHGYRRHDVRRCPAGGHSTDGTTCVRSLNAGDSSA